MLNQFRAVPGNRPELHLAAALERLRQGHLVGVLEVAATGRSLASLVTRTPAGFSIAATYIAVSIEQTIRVQNALDDTQLRIEGVQGQLRLLDDRTSLATIRVGLREEGVALSEVDTPSIPNAFERSVAGFVGVIAGVVIGLGYLIPIALLGALVWFVVVRLRRRDAR